MEGAAAVTLGLEALDKELTLAINSMHTGFTDSVWLLFSDRQVWYLLYLALALLLFLRMNWKKAVVVLVSVVLTVVACDQFANVIKETVGRLRPCWDAYMVGNGLHRLEWKGSQYGFFSAHAANSFGVAASLVQGFKVGDKSRSYRGMAWFMYPWAFLVSISRIFVGKHFLGDVLVGAAVGLVFGLLAARLARWIINKYSLSL